MKRLKRITALGLEMVLVFAVVLFLGAIFTESQIEKNKIGSFSSEALVDGWVYTDEETKERMDVSLPLELQEKPGQVVVLTNVLPSGIKDGMRMAFRPESQMWEVYINGELRAIHDMTNALYPGDAPRSAFILFDLNNSDAGGEIKLKVTSYRERPGKINGINYGFGNNVWFNYIKGSLSLGIMAIILIVVGAGSIIGYLLLKNKIQGGKPIYYLALTIVATGLWIVSEININQLLFKTQSLSKIFSYVLIALIAALASMFFDEVQGHRYEKLYVPVQLICLIQVVVNIVLDFTKIAGFRTTLIFSHLWSLVAILTAVGTIVADFRKKQLAEYRIVAMGMGWAIVGALGEIVWYYINNIHSIGFLLGIGLVIMMITTIAQVFRNEIHRANERRDYAERMNRTTIRTIASIIDAKDEYTGGHSERVGKYAGILSDAVKDIYEFTNADVERIRYIGMMHDIGKVGVADSVLNKPGKLDDDEFCKMQQHTVVGDSIVKNMEDVPGLREGVRNHHERWDGKGYPDKLSGENIPIYARILCLADCYDAMTSDRVYRKRLSDEVVYAEIKKCAGTQFDPKLAEIFLKLIDEGKISADNEG